MNISILQNIDEKSVLQLDELLHKLDPQAPALSRTRLESLAGEADFKLFTASDSDGNLAGMLTLTCCQTLSRSKYWIEDVVVDPVCRGKGIGRALVRAAVNFVKEKKDDSVIYLTSNPSRIAARALYRSEGFEEYETGVFRIKRINI